MARKTNDLSIKPEQREEIKARVLIGEDIKDLAIEYNISDNTIRNIIKEMPSNIDTQMHELTKYRPEVLTKVLDKMPEITDDDADTVSEAVLKMQELDTNLTNTAVTLSEKLFSVASAIDENDAAALSKLSQVTSTLVQLRNGFFKQGTVIQIGGNINNNTLTLIKNGGKV